MPTVPLARPSARIQVAPASRSPAAERFIVLAEVGSKQAAVRLTPEQWAQAAAGDLEAGATWILAEGRASGTVGIYESSGAIRQDVAEALAAAVGPDVNLANVSPYGALGLETFRLSLRSDTYGAWTPGPLMGTAPVRGT